MANVWNVSTQGSNSAFDDGCRCLSLVAEHERQGIPEETEEEL
jgi:hypothetical protein